MDGVYITHFLFVFSLLFFSPLPPRDKPGFISQPPCPVLHSLGMRLWRTEPPAEGVLPVNPPAIRHRLFFRTTFSVRHEGTHLVFSARPRLPFLFHGGPPGRPYSGGSHFPQALPLRWSFFNEFSIFFPAPDDPRLPSMLTMLACRITTA